MKNSCHDQIRWYNIFYCQQPKDKRYGRTKLQRIFKNTVCTNALYTYVELGFLKIRNTNLPQKLKRIQKSTRIRINKKKFGKSISERPKYINLRKKLIVGK